MWICQMELGFLVFPENCLTNYSCPQSESHSLLLVQVQEKELVMVKDLVRDLRYIQR